MKNLKNYRTKSYLLCASILMIGLSSCSKNNPLSSNCLSGSWIQNVETELSNWTEASQAYSQDPSPENCEKNKQAITAYINALDEIIDCVPTVSRSEFDAEIDDARIEISATNCNE